MNTIDILGDDEALKQVIERTITEFEDNELLAIEESAFRGCNNLTSVNFPNVTDLGDYAFGYCSSLTSVNFPNVTWVGNDTFSSCSSLTSVDFPNATGLGARALKNCSSLTSVNFPKLTDTSNAFSGCSSLTSVNFPKVTKITSYAFEYCYSLTSAKFPLVTSISNNVFDSCSKLKTLYIGIESDKVCTLSNANAIPSNVTDIYVPYNLQDKYKTATNWSSFASKIQGYEVPVTCQSLTITAEDVPWYETSTIVHYEAVCTYSIEGIMQPETKIYKGDVVSDTFDTNSSEESSRQVEVSYTFLGQTATIAITQGKCIGNPVGGKIYYINDTADGTYLFYDVEGNLMSDVSVGSAPGSYTVLTAGSKDKYYVYQDAIYNSLQWGKYGTTTGATGTAIGTGKSNTAILLATDAVSNTKTIWYKLQQIRNASTGGCSDWFAPSRSEIEKLILAVNSGNITGGTIAGSSYAGSVFKSNILWCSNENGPNYASIWNYGNQNWSSNTKSTYYSVFFVRAF